MAESYYERVDGWISDSITAPQELPINEAFQTQNHTYKSFVFCPSCRASLTPHWRPIADSETVIQNLSLDIQTGMCRLGPTYLGHIIGEEVSSHETAQ
jgi:hypothetical protein